MMQLSFLFASVVRQMLHDNFVPVVELRDSEYGYVCNIFLFEVSD